MVYEVGHLDPTDNLSSSLRVIRLSRGGEGKTKLMKTIHTTGANLAVEALNLAQDDFVYVPYQHPAPPLILPSEMDEPMNDYPVDPRMEKFMQDGEARFIRSAEGE